MGEFLEMADSFLASGEEAAATVPATGEAAAALPEKIKPDIVAKNQDVAIANNKGKGFDWSKLPTPAAGTGIVLLLILFVVFAIVPISSTNNQSRLMLLWSVLVSGGKLGSPADGSHSIAAAQALPTSGTAGVDAFASGMTGTLRQDYLYSGRSY